MDKFERIRDWARDRNFMTDATAAGQFKKFLEEAGELGEALIDSNEDEIIDGIGDCVVVLTNIALLRGMNIEDCIHHAYKQIKDRKGLMLKGKFVKYKDLTDEQKAIVDSRV